MNKKYYKYVFVLLIIGILGTIALFCGGDPWPDSGLAALICEPEFAWKTEITQDTADMFQARVVGVKFEEYVEMCSSAFNRQVNISAYHEYAPGLKPFSSLTDMYRHTTDSFARDVLAAFEKDNLNREFDDSYYCAYDEHGNRLTVHHGNGNIFITVQSAKAVAEALAEHAPDVTNVPQEKGDFEAHYKEQIESLWETFDEIEENMESLKEKYTYLRDEP